MADTLNFELAVPEALLLSAEVEMVVVPGIEGDFGVLPGHALLMSTVRPGVIEVYEEGKITRRIFVADGFAQVTGERCTVLAGEAVPTDEIERGAAEDRLRAAELELKDADTDEERARAEVELAVAQAMLDALTTS